MIDFLKNNLSFDTNIKLIALTGSSVYSDNHNDIDYFVLLSNAPTKYIHLFDKENHIDYFCYDEKYFKSLLSFKRVDSHSINLFFVMLHRNHILYGSDDSNWDLLTHKEKYLNMLKTILPKTVLNPQLSSINGTPLKLTTLALIPLFWIENNGYFLTDSQKEVIENAKNKTLDWSWVEWIRSKLFFQEMSD